MNKPRVLIVEDNWDTMELVRFLVKHAGYDALTARDGREGLDVARQQLPDLILLDLEMPQIDGWSAAKALKADPATSGIPLVAMTAYALPGDRRRALEAGCDAYIAKPLHVASFLQDLRRYLDGDFNP